MSTARKLIDALEEDFRSFPKDIEPTYLKLVEFFPLETVTSRSQHEMALKIAEKLMAFIEEQGLDDKGVEVYLRTLTRLIADYERGHYKSGPTSGVEMLAYLMDLQGLNQTDLSKDLGGQSVVSKVLRGERELNLRQVRALAKRFKVSPSVFI